MVTNQFIRLPYFNNIQNPYNVYKDKQTKVFNIKYFYLMKYQNLSLFLLIEIFTIITNTIKRPGSYRCIKGKVNQMCNWYISLKIIQKYNIFLNVNLSLKPSQGSSLNSTLRLNPYSQMLIFRIQKFMNDGRTIICVCLKSLETLNIHLLEYFSDLCNRNKLLQRKSSYTFFVRTQTTHP